MSGLPKRLGGKSMGGRAFGALRFHFLVGNSQSPGYLAPTYEFDATNTLPIL